MNIGIVTDSTSAFNNEEQEKLGIDVVSLYVNKDDTFFKATELSREEYYRELETAKEIPKTSQPNPQDFQVVYEKRAGEFDALIVPVISQAFSGTFDSAVLAADVVDIDVKVIDSKLINFGLEFLVRNLCEKINKGEELDTLITYASDFYKQIKVMFSVDSLNYLYKGGRIGRAKALMGGLLNMKPIISLVEGELHPIASVRGNKKLIERIIELSLQSENRKLKRAGIIHVNREEDAKNIKNQLNEEFPNIDIYIKTAESVVVTHLGPSAIGLFTEWL
ncbi:MAG: DegV family protein [Thermotogota bacterium]|nr:DegV family protein [Thermotogota bacterium]